MPPWFATLVILALHVSGCAMAGSEDASNVESPTLKVSVHHQSATCGKLTESQWLPDQQRYESTFQAMFQGLVSDSKPQTKIINFDKYGMLFISMGQQRTGGYSIKLSSEQMQVKDGRATIEVNWVTAKRGMVTIQMLTNPCLLLLVPRANYRVIDVVDQSGTLRQSINVNGE